MVLRDINKEFARNGAATDEDWVIVIAPVRKIEENLDFATIDFRVQMSPITNLLVSRRTTHDDRLIIFSFERFAGIKGAAFVKKLKMKDSIFSDPDMACPDGRRVGAGVDFGGNLLIIPYIDTLRRADYLYFRLIPF